MSQLWQCIIADFKQRTRQQSFVVTLLVMSVLTLLFFPSPESSYQTLVIDGYRGIYNSAWIGICLAMLNVLFLPLVCFYLVKNALELDRYSMTCELIAATPMNKLTFLLAKWCASVAILVSIVVAMLLSSMLIQLYYGESYQLDIWALTWPQLVFVLPMLLAIAAIALMFESIKWLKGGLGNVIYFFLWIGSIVQAIESVTGVGATLDDLEKEITERFPSNSGTTNIGVSISDETNEIKTFVWQGIEPTMAHLQAALPMLFVCLTCLGLAFITFDRFSKSSALEHKPKLRFTFSLKTKVVTLLDKIFIELTKPFAFTRLLRLELKLFVKGQSGYWYSGLLVLNIIQLFISDNLLISLFLPLSWLWCVLVISQLGQLEKQSNTSELVIYSRHAPVLHSLASYCASWILLALASIASVLRFIGTAEWLLLVQLIIAISFTASLAYFCGTVTGSKRMFEVLYPALCYIGPMQTALYLDFFGVNGQLSWEASIPFYFLAISIGLLMLSVKAKSTR